MICHIFNNNHKHQWCIYLFLLVLKKILNAIPLKQQLIKHINDNF